MTGIRISMRMGRRFTYQRMAIMRARTNMKPRMDTTSIGAWEGTVQHKEANARLVAWPKSAKRKTDEWNGHWPPYQHSQGFFYLLMQAWTFFFASAALCMFHISPCSFSRQA